MVQKIYSKMYQVSCTNTYHDVTYLVKHLAVKNTKTWISREWSIIFLSKKNNLNLYLRWHISRNYCFVAEVTVKVKLFNFSQCMLCWYIFWYVKKWHSWNWELLLIKNEYVYWCIVLVTLKKCNSFTLVCINSRN